MAPRWPSVSVGIPTHGRPALVRRAVDAVLSQSYPGSIECIVVHDAEEPDPSLEFRGPDRSVTVLRNHHVRGLPGARNSALDTASGELIGWCDDDDVWHADKLERQVAALLTQPSLPAAGSGLRWLSSDGRVVNQHAARSPVTRHDILRYANGPLGLHSSAMLVRRAAYDVIGGYAEDLPAGRCEDLEFCLRVSSLGPIATVQDPLVDVRWDPESDFSIQRWRTMAEAMEIVLARNPDFDDVPGARGRACRRIATNYSSAGMHRLALAWAARAARSNPRDARAWLVGVAACLHIRVVWVLRLVRGIRRRRGRLRPFPATVPDGFDSDRRTNGGRSQAPASG